MIIGSFNKIPKKTNSHSFGWARTWSENLGVDIDHNNGKHSDVYLLHGANFGGSLNLFGGMNNELQTHINNLLESENITSLDIDMPDYGAMLKKRKDVVDKGWCDAITQRLSEASTLKSNELSKFSQLAIGDSHTAAYSCMNSSVIKRDGTTLNSQINSNFEYITDHIMPHHKGLTISLGNIDVRHHICRVNANIGDMLSSLNDFGKSTGLEVEYSVPWPVEFEGRKLPKSGQYKGQNFWGSLEDRQHAVTEWENIMIDLGMERVKPPEPWYLLDAEIYARTRMEGTQSVHLNPNFYRRHNWGEVSGGLEDFF